MIGTVSDLRDAVMNKPLYQSAWAAIVKYHWGLTQCRLEAGKFRIKVLADLVPGESFLPCR